jgi:hypothetical protein
LNAGDGDAVYLADASDGGFRITSTNPQFARKMKLAERLSRHCRNALKELAKRWSRSGSTELMTPMLAAGWEHAKGMKAPKDFRVEP